MRECCGTCKPSGMSSPRSRLVSRRDALQVLGTGIAALPLAACGAPMIGPDDDAGVDARAPGQDAHVPGRDAHVPGRDAATSNWASGGTAAMTGAADYPDPFEGAGGSACALTAAATLGPCYFDSPVRRDVSEGYPGLPVRLALRVVDEACAPIEGARVEIWHTRNSGLYSGGPITFCTSGDADATAHLYFRGGQISDADGQVAFDTCFPGWYPGRAIHIHFQIFLEDGASATNVSQLFFAPDVIEEIFASHPDYAPFGQPDRPNASDGIYNALGEVAVAQHSRMSDGAMLAWLQIAVRPA
jgi:protocatechuate 3,4-dioxygenase beta subunit